MGGATAAGSSGPSMTAFLDPDEGFRLPREQLATRPTHYQAVIAWFGYVCSPGQVTEWRGVFVGLPCTASLGVPGFGGWITYFVYWV
ncbi:hypothetical protein BDW71DRAFT_190155 [Aspergillus fruticulosus]